MILVPPADPTTSRGLFKLVLTKTVGVMEDNGLLPGLMKLVGDGGSLKKFVMFGEEKSSISSFKIIPVEGDMMPDPKLHKDMDYLFLTYTSFMSQCHLQ